MWFTYALITLLFWAFADLFYKKGAKENDKYSHLKTTIDGTKISAITPTVPTTVDCRGSKIYDAVRSNS